MFFRGAFALDLTRNGTTTRFAGPAFGTREDGGREIATRDTVHGLNITRKVFVPDTGYFARFVESFSNPTGEPITVDVSIASKLYGGRTSFCCVYDERDHYVATTSSGDSAIGTDDEWISLGGSGSNPYVGSYDGASLGVVFDGPGGSDTIDSVTWTPSAADNPLTYGWNSITIPAGGTVSLMHFVSAQGGAQGATASAQRLVQLPPEALDGLAPDEILTITNFAVPAGGVSAVAPLPAITGTVTGRVYEGDGTTPVPGASVTFQSTAGVFPRRLTFGTNAGGEFTLTGGIGAPVPIADFNLFASYPNVNFTNSQTDTVSFPESATSVSHDIVFAEYGILTGVVTRHTGAPVRDAYVTGPYQRYAYTAADGRWRIGGVPAQTYTLSGQINHPQGTALQIQPTVVTLAKGQVRDDALVIEPTGTLTGVLKNAAGALQVGRSVQVSNAGNTFQRYTTTDTSGRFALTDMRLGAFTLSSNDPVSGFPATLPVTIAQDQTTDVELRYLGSGTITVTVLRENGAPAQGFNVTVSGTGFSRPTLVTNSGGQVTVTDIPIGQVASVVTRHPANSSITVTSQVTLTPETGGVAAITQNLPGFGMIQTEVRRPNGTLAGAGVPVQISGNTGSFSANTDVNSLVTLGPVLTNRTFTHRVSHPTTTISFTRPFLETAQAGLTTDGEVKSVAAHYPAIARVVITVTDPNLTPVVGAKVETADALSPGFFRDRGLTNASGVVEVAQVPEGAFNVRVYQPSTTTVIELATGDVLAANDGGTVNKSISYRNFTVTVRGRIFQADGVTPLPLPFAVELLRAVDRQFIARRCVTPVQCGWGTDPGADGEVVFANVKSTGAGLILRSFAPLGGSSVGVYETAVTPSANGEVIATITQPFLRATLQGHVFAVDGTTPVGAGTVFARTLGNYSSLGVSVQPDGSYAFAPTYLPVEGMKLRLSLAGVNAFDTPTGPITALNQVVTTNILLPPTVYTTVRGRVVAGDGVTPITAGVAIRSTATNTVLSSFGSNADGRFETRLALPVSDENCQGACALEAMFTVRATSNANSAVFVESSHTATSQGGVVDVGDLVLPVSVIRGRVTYGASTPVPYPNVFAYDAATTSSYFPDVTNGEGEFTFVGLPAGTFTITANDDDGLEASIEVTLTTETSVVTNAYVQLPELATLNVHVVDRLGNQPALANVVVRASQGFERYLGWFEDGTSGGSFTLTVPLGEVTVEGEVLTCADRDTWDTCVGESATVSVVLDTPNEFVDLAVPLGDNGSVYYSNIFTVPEGGGAGQLVTGPVEVSFLGQSHSLLSPQRTEVIARDGNFEWPHLNLPSGPLRVMMRSGNYMDIVDIDGPEPNTAYGVEPFPLYWGQRVLFSLIQDDDSPFANTRVHVVIRVQGTERRLTATTNAQGNLLVEGFLPWDDSTVTFYLLDGSGISMEVTVSPSGEDPQPIDVRSMNF